MSSERFDPVRFHYLEVLSRRVDEASGEVRRILQDKLDRARADYEQGLAQAPRVAGKPPLRTPPSATPLAQLNQYIRSLAHDSGDAEAGQGQDAVDDIKSARRFRDTWSRIAAEKQVNEAFDRGPENAGPLNAHMLVLHSLRLMRDLSPHYLQQFMSQVDSLLWLDQVNQKYTLTDSKPARPSRARK
ncbi:MAG: DUF2894 domain-containing protein [Leptothrix sp. (in: Bacteria)]|nr:DUF2894 domain-containing protein [Leptothrix sp. (in: b-proteobacteria)]